MPQFYIFQLFAVLLLLYTKIWARNEQIRPVVVWNHCPIHSIVFNSEFCFPQTTIVRLYSVNLSVLWSWYLCWPIEVTRGVSKTLPLLISHITADLPKLSNKVNYLYNKHVIVKIKTIFCIHKLLTVECFWCAPVLWKAISRVVYTASL